ncbi:Thoeris anti-defense Tad2 family protein [Photorhabdus khanii]|uniref:DUF2829 domain-containing protein n=1 Tax=Photorhabdus khanii subsp. guanajuatensis TaxID=2100166 RepID=A0A4R4J6C6_9GAMM|nr:MW1434 family type I TA system toxin [Photorhabdus khanii]TDB48259.1 hypothetical protein C5467_19495 [Photorhabdus khanii subsp. guanajuatensis]
MSEMNKPEVTETENKTPEHERALNPNQYKCNHVVAPENSCPWAIIQVYLGNQARRGDWDSPNEYIRLIPESTANSEGSLIYIEKCDKHGHWLPWQPTPEDIMGSDWSLLELMVFDITLGTGKYKDNSGVTGWGYYGIDNDLLSPFGTLNVIKNKTDIAKTTVFYWNERGGYNPPLFIFGVFSRESSESYQKVQELFKSKNLYITVDDITYNLGTPSSIGIDGDSSWYEGTEAQKLGAIMKQTGKTKRFYCIWR